MGKPHLEHNIYFLPPWRRWKALKHNIASGAWITTVTSSSRTEVAPRHYRSDLSNVVTTKFKAVQAFFIGEYVELKKVVQNGVQTMRGVLNVALCFVYINSMLEQYKRPSFNTIGLYKEVHMPTQTGVRTINTMVFLANNFEMKHKDRLISMLWDWTGQCRARDANHTIILCE